MDVRQTEYDRFGPWVTEITEEDPVPPLFAPYVKDLESALLSLKVPRKIERRQANPGMDLYDFLVTAYDDHLLILRRDGNTVSSQRCRYDEIHMIHFVEDLLDGRLQLMIAGGAVELPFNSVSSDVMLKLLQLVRDRYTPETKYGTDSITGIEPSRGLSFYFQGRLSEYRSTMPDFTLCATQAEMPVGHTEVSGFKRMFFRLFGRRLTESLHYSNGRELLIVHHGRKYRFLRRPLYAQHTTHIPVKDISAVKWDDDPDNTSIVNLKLGTEAAEFTVGLAKDNPCISSYSVFLSNALEAGS